MNAINRANRNKTINQFGSRSWNERLEEVMKRHGYHQKTFAKAYKERYGTGNQADVSRWMRVGSVITKEKGKENETQSVIGFPSYDTMKRIADFFDVSVGYLTGETSFESFDMEQACTYFHIDKKAGESLLDITDSHRPIEKYENEERQITLKYLLSAPGFGDFLQDLYKLATIKLAQTEKSPTLNAVAKSLSPEILNEGLDLREICTESGGTSQGIEAMKDLDDAMDKDDVSSTKLDMQLRVIKYSLLEKHIKLIDEIINESFMAEIAALMESQKYQSDNVNSNR